MLVGIEVLQRQSHICQLRIGKVYHKPLGDRIKIVPQISLCHWKGVLVIITCVIGRLVQSGTLDRTQRKQRITRLGNLRVIVFFPLGTEQVRFSRLQFLLQAVHKITILGDIHAKTHLP